MSDKVIRDNEGNVIGRIEDAPSADVDPGCGCGFLLVSLLACGAGIVMHFVEGRRDVDSLLIPVGFLVILIVGFFVWLRK
ncbi:MAG: hypothetical protein ACYC7A_22285 [Thermoanaerobaculia bacterium]